ncbi:transposase, partial [Colletotrichum incanum]
LINIILTYPYSESRIIASRARPLPFYLFNLYISFPLRTNMQSTLIESRIILAIQALKKDLKMPVRRAASTFEVPESTLCDRRAGRVAQGKRRPNLIKITITKEEVILERVINLIDRGFPLRQEDV